MPLFQSRLFLFLLYMKTNKKNGELQTRREFFKNAVKKTLPVIGVMALASIPETIKAACSAPMGCNSTCQLACAADCRSGCRGKCADHCQKSCSTSSCTGSCRGGCENSCQRSCWRSCKDSCRGTEKPAY